MARAPAQQTPGPGQSMPPNLFNAPPAAAKPAAPKPEPVVEKQQPPDSTAIRCSNRHHALGQCARNEHPPDELHKGAMGDKWTDEQATAPAPIGKPASSLVSPEDAVASLLPKVAVVPQPEAAPAVLQVAPAVVAAAPVQVHPAAPVAPAQAPPAVPPKPTTPAPKPAPPPVRAAAPTISPQQPAKPQHRMVVPGQRVKPAEAQRRGYRFFLWGEKKIGKTEFVVDAEDVAFIPAETSPNVPEDRCFAQPETWADIATAVRAFLETPGSFRGICIDTGDAANALLVEHIKQKAVGGAGSSKGAIKFASDIGGGYKSDEKALVEEWTVLLALLDRVRDRGFNVFILGHSGLGKQINPDGTDYMIWNPRMPEPVAALITGWADIVGFAQKEVTVEKVSKFRAKGASTGAHMLHLQSTKATFFAGNRYNLPSKMALSYVAFAAAMLKRTTAETTGMVDAINERLAQIPEDYTIQTMKDGAPVEVKVVEWARAAIAGSQSVGFLAKLDSRLRAITDELAAAAEPEADEEQPPQ